MTFLFLKIAGLMLLAAGFGAWLARWFFRHRYEDVTVQYTGWQNDWAQWRKGLDSKLSLRQMIDLSPVTERLNELESLVRGFGMPKPPPVDLEPVLDAVKAIRIPEPPAYDFTPLYSRMYEVEQHVASIRIPDLAPLHERIDSLEASVQRSVAAIEIPKPIPTDLSPVMAGLASLVDSTRAGLASASESARADLAPLYDRVNDLDTAVRDLPRPAPVDLVPVLDRLAAVDAHVGAIRIPEQPPAPNLQPLHAKLDAVEKAVADIRMPSLDLAPVHARLGEIEQSFGRSVAQAFAAIPAPVPPRETDLTPVIARVAAVEAPVMQRLAALDNRVQAIRFDPPPPVDLAPLQAKVDALEAALAAVLAAAQSRSIDFAPLEARLAQLESSLARTLAESVGRLPQPASAKEPDFTAVLSRLAAVDARVQGIKLPPAPPTVNLTPLHDKLDAMSRVVGTLKLPPLPPPAAPMPPPVDLAPLRSSLEKRLDTLERAVSGIRMPAAAPAVDLKPIVDRLAGLEAAIGRLESGARVEAMTLRRASPVAATAVEPAPRKPAAPPPPLAASVAPAVVPPIAAPQTQRAATASPEPEQGGPPPGRPKVGEPARGEADEPSVGAQLGLAFDTRHIRSGSRNLLTHAVFGKGDDLKEIVGVAAGLERLLHDVGVYYFWQIAEWTEKDIAYVDARLKAFKGRITRDAWIAQCVKLAAKSSAAPKPAG
jgi:tetrahydromethanopterin S-methyltransferase subunit B